MQTQRQKQVEFSLSDSLLELFHPKGTRRVSGSQAYMALSYEALEEKRALASLFPTYVNGEFTLGDDTGASPYALEDTFNLSSNPTATKTIFLDYDGHHSVNNSWGHDIVFPAFDRDGDASSFSDAELIEIQLNFQNIAEDFLPFDVNVTTTDPGLAALTKTSARDQTYGIRDVHTQATDGFGDFGGIAFLNSFDDSIDNPVFTLNKGENNGALTGSHEIGHSLGLGHDGLGSSSYHPGAGRGEVSWGPIQGAPFGANITQWSNGDYEDSTNAQDDFAVITKSANGFGFRDDDYGSTIATAADLEVDASSSVFQWGIIEQNSDVDVFRFETGSGEVNFSINPFQERPNLDIEATLYDANGNVVAVSNPANDVDASFNEVLSAGTYYIGIDGVGNANSSDYGSVGFYTIEGEIVESGSLTSVGEAGTVSINHRWQTISLERTYDDPVIVFSPALRAGGSPTTIRVADVTENSFRVQLDEWDYLDGTHSFEEVSYIVLEAGIHELADGTTIQAQNSSVNQQWANIDFELGAFDSTPLVFSQATSVNDPTAVATRARNIDANGFQVRLQEEQAADRFHATETVSWIAIEEVGVGTLGTGDQFQASQTGIAVSHRPYSSTFQADFDSTPVFLAAIQSFEGGDVATTRAYSLSERGYTINVEEERSADFEVGHNAESIGFFALPAGIINAQSDEGGDDPAFLRASFDTDVAFDNYVAGTNTAEAWAAYDQMRAWGEDSVALHNHGEHDHDHDHDDEGHDDGDYDHDHTDGAHAHNHEDDDCQCAMCCANQQNHEQEDVDYDRDHHNDDQAVNDSRVDFLVATPTGSEFSITGRIVAAACNAVDTGIENSTDLAFEQFEVNVEEESLEQAIEFDSMADLG